MADEKGESVGPGEFYPALVADSGNGCPVLQSFSVVSSGSLTVR